MKLKEKIYEIELAAIVVNSSNLSRSVRLTARYQIPLARMIISVSDSGSSSDCESASAC